MSATGNPVQTPEKTGFDKLADFIGDCFSRLFSEARVLAREAVGLCKLPDIRWPGFRLTPF